MNWNRNEHLYCNVTDEEINRNYLPEGIIQCRCGCEIKEEGGICPECHTTAEELKEDMRREQM